jgi:hypothetical protein
VKKPEMTLFEHSFQSGSFYVCNGCDPDFDTDYVLVSGYIHGVVEFVTPLTAKPITQALLSVNPYALPLFGLDLSVYGIAYERSFLSNDVVNTSTFLGNWSLPPDLHFGQEAFFDITAFLRTVTTPYVVFVLNDCFGCTDLFSSQTEVNLKKAGPPWGQTILLAPVHQSILRANLNDQA